MIVATIWVLLAMWALLEYSGRHCFHRPPEPEPTVREPGWCLAEARRRKPDMDCAVRVLGVRAERPPSAVGELAWWGSFADIPSVIRVESGGVKSGRTQQQRKNYVGDAP